MKKILLIITLFYSISSFCQQNFDSLSHVNFVTSHDTYLNDVWGHVDALGNEYALVGARKGTSIVDVTNPSNPVEIYWEAGDESIWRDVNTWQNYAFVTTEAESGLLIIDMNSLPNASGITSTFYSGTLGNEWQSAHTLFIDSAGYAYIFGANRGNGGVIILDIHTDPMNPIEVGTFDDWYCHDGYVLGDTMYLAHISEGFMSIVDISDKANPILLGTKTTHNTFTHNIWTSPDGQFGFSTDEVSGAFIGSYDLSDPTNIIELDLIQSSPGKGVIPHNVHYMNEYLIASYYSDGVTIFDASRPANLVQIANFDTYPTQTKGFDGTWASYPFLPSGIVLAADITEGLFIAKPTYKRASFLEGNVKNAEDTTPLSNVEIGFTNKDYTEFSKTNGDYATGLSGDGQFQVVFNKVGFYPQIIDVNLIAGQVTVLNVNLAPIPKFNFKVTVKDKATNQVLLDAHVELKSSLTTDEILTNGLGEANFQLYYEESYNVIVGKWGYKTTCFEQIINQNTGEIIILLEKGIYDDFSFDFGWTSSSTVGTTSGLWERAIPFESETNSAPDFDSEFDCGSKAFVTGNIENSISEMNEVASGEVTLYSPIFDLSADTNPFLHYDRWFFNYHGPIPPFDDSLKIFISNGDSTVLLDSQASDLSAFFTWNKKSFRLKDFIALSQNMQLIVKTSDLDPKVNITEAGIDNFFIDSIDHFAPIAPPIDSGEFVIYPNPVQDKITILNGEIGEFWTFYDLNGKELLSKKMLDNVLEFDLSHFQAGIYFLKSTQGVYKILKN
ncbi:MAG: choice-of-anchor B family protein [Bacteroidota bacterium]